jgi:hypothetical protein
MSYRLHIRIFTLFFLIAALYAGMTYVSAPHVLSEIKTITNNATSSPIMAAPEKITGKQVLVNLGTMKLELLDGTSTPIVIDIVSKGKPGSYYETPGGNYTTEYKIRNHFSSIGLVYMPYSVHVFGNFFIHGIPYYPDGTEVSSTYSGGCIRLRNEDAQKVYAFVEKGTPVRITGAADETFTYPEEIGSQHVENMDMTRLMVAAISLEFLTQDNEISFEGMQTTRRTILPDLLVYKDDTVSIEYTETLGRKGYVARMNEKAKALGLNNTTFTDVTTPAVTTPKDSERFFQYIKTYKSYLLSLQAKA